MTTEDDFQAKLDANLRDWQTRLVFADWLQDHGDPRADGYRALGLLRTRLELNHAGTDAWWHRQEPDSWGHMCNDLPADWFDLMDEAEESDLYHMWPDIHHKRDRRAVEDAAALAFLQLPAARRAELLTEAV